MVSIDVVRNNNARKFDPSCRIHRGCCRLGRKQSKEHFLQICGYAYDEWNRGKEILTEAKLMDGKARADLFILDTGEAIEVAITEDISSLQHKEKIWKEHGFDMYVYGNL